MFRIFYKAGKRILLVIVFASIFFTISCEEVLQESLVGKKVELIAPGDNVTTGSPINFSWESLSGVDKYRIRVMSPSFGSEQVLIIDSLTAATFLPLSLNAGKYQWRVQATNSISVSAESEARTLNIE